MCSRNFMDLTLRCTLRYLYQYFIHRDKQRIFINNFINISSIEINNTLNKEYFLKSASHNNTIVKSLQHYRNRKKYYSGKKMNKIYQEYATLFEKPVLLTALKYNSLAYQSSVNTLLEVIKSK